MLRILLALFSSSSFASFYVLQRLHLFYLLYEICLLVVELFVLGPVCMEPCQELHKFLAVPKQYFLNWTWLVGVCNKHLHSDIQQSEFLTNY